MYCWAYYLKQSSKVSYSIVWVQAEGLVPDFPGGPPDKIVLEVNHKKA